MGKHFDIKLCIVPVSISSNSSPKKVHSDQTASKSWISCQVWRLQGRLKWAGGRFEKTKLGVRAWKPSRSGTSLLFKHTSPFPRVLIGCGSLLPGVANFTPSQSASQLYLSGRVGGGDVGEKQRKTQIQRTAGTCQVEPLKAHTQPNVLRLGVMCF